MPKKHQPGCPCCCGSFVISSQRDIQAVITGVVDDVCVSANCADFNGTYTIPGTTTLVDESWDKANFASYCSIDATLLFDFRCPADGKTVTDSALVVRYNNPAVTIFYNVPDFQLSSFLAGTAVICTYSSGPGGFPFCDPTASEIEITLL